MCPFELVAIPMPSPIYTLGGNFMKLGTTLNGMSGAFIALGSSERPPPRPPGAVWAGAPWPPAGGWLPPPGGAGIWPPPAGAWAPPEDVGVCPNRVIVADSASATAAPLIQRVFIGSLDNDAKCNTTTRSRTPYFGSGFHQQISARRARVLVPDAAVSQVAAATFPCLHVLRRLHAGFGRRCAPVQNVGQIIFSLQRTSHRFHRGNQSVQHGLVAERGLAALLDAVDAGLKQRHYVGRREL